MDSSKDTQITTTNHRHEFRPRMRTPQEMENLKDLDEAHKLYQENQDSTFMIKVSSECVNRVRGELGINNDKMPPKIVRFLGISTDNGKDEYYVIPDPLISLDLVMTYKLGERHILGFHPGVVEDDGRMGFTICRTGDNTVKELYKIYLDEISEIRLISSKEAKKRMHPNTTEVVTDTDKENATKKHEVKIYTQDYHGTQVEILELDHHDSKLNGESFELPDDWKEILANELEKTTGVLAPEYCMPDLDRYLFSKGAKGFFAEAKLGGPAREILFTGEPNNDPDSMIGPFYGFISKMAGKLQRDMIATDTANQAVYWLFSGASLAVNQSRDYYGRLYRTGGFHYDYGRIDSSEYKKHDSNDARHLVTARGLMQEVLRFGDSQITAIWAPYHAERISDYITRQISTENENPNNVNSPVDFKDVSPKDEAKKMVMYGRPPLMRSVRRYHPALSKFAYEIDLTVNDQPLNLDYLIILMDKYMRMNPINESESRYQRRVEKVLEKLKKGSKLHLKGLLNTDRIGWKQIQNSYVY